MARMPSPAVLAAITAGVVLVAAGTGVLLQPTKERAAQPDRGSGVSIDVVAPREPELVPGGVMEVGELADSYTHRGYIQPAAIVDRSYVPPEDDPPARIEPRRPERLRDVAAEPARPPVIFERRDPPRRGSFGFDQPQPDYAAERRERAARRDEQQRFEEARRRERFEARADYPEPGYDSGREERPVREDRGRERQWYGSDGRRVGGPDPYD